MATKTVRFYALVEIDDHGEERIYEDLDRAELLKLLEKAITNNQATVELAQQGESLIAKRLGKRGPAYCIALYRVSSQDLPMLYDEQTGEFRSLDDVIGNEEYDIAEPTYFGFLPGGILGFVFNQSGPKPKGLMHYLGEVTNLEADARPIPRRDILDVVEQADGIKVFTVKVPTASAGALRGTTLADAGQIAETMQAGDIEVILRARGDVQRQRLARQVKEVAGRLIPPLRQQSRAKLKVELDADEDYAGARALDLLDEYFVMERDIDTIPGRRYLDESEAAKAIAAAYNELRVSLHEAVGGMSSEE